MHVSHIITKIITTSDLVYEQVYNLREEMLRVPIGLSLKDEDLSADELDTIVVAMQGDTVTGCVMIQTTGDGETVKFRQMAVAASVQGQGIGRTLIEAAEKHLLDKGYKKIKLHARTTAEGFYKKLGYKTVSDVFTEVGIPHVVMEKDVA